MRNGFARKPGIVFVARFFAALIVFYLVIASNPVNDHVIVPFTELIVHTTAFVLRGMHEPIEVVGTVIRTSPRFALDVRNGCNAVEAMMLLAAAMIAFPATLRSRLTGLLVASAAIQIVNLVRISSLVWLGEHHREAFDIVHVAVWQTIVILFALTMFVFWSLKFAEKPVQARH
jgi:exosortase H (IPTLxxWG-CTERM-specific)